MQNKYKIGTTISFDRRFNDLVVKGRRPVKMASKRPVKPNYHRIIAYSIAIIIVLYFCSTIQVSFDKPIERVEAQTTDLFPQINHDFESADMPREDVTIEDKIKTAFPDDWKIMLAIARAESNLRPNAYNDSTKYPCVGIFQIRLLPERGLTRSEMEDVDSNINYAKILHDKYGFSPWSAYNNKSYLRYIK